MIAKGEKINLTKAEQNMLRTILAEVVRAYTARRAPMSQVGSRMLTNAR